MSDVIPETILASYGITGLIAFVLALIAVGVFVNFVSRKLMNLRIRMPWVRNVDKTIDPTLKDHLFFTNAKFKLRFDIPSLELAPDRPALQRMYRDLIYLNVESYYYGCRRLIETNDMSTLSGTEWGTRVKNELQSMTKAYEEKAEDFGVPTVIVGGYAHWLEPYNTMLVNYVDQLSNSPVYGNSILRTNVFLLVMNLLIVTMIGDLDKLARDTQDQVQGIEYRGSFLEDS